MSRSSTLISLGLLTVLTPFSGLPIDIRTLLTVILGASVFGVGFTLRSQEIRRAQSVTTPPAEPLAPEQSPPQGMSSI